MNTTQRLLNISARPKLRLSEIERLLRLSRAIVPVPSRRTLIKLCESNELEGVRMPAKSGNGHWLVYEDSFLAWITGLDET